MKKINFFKVLVGWIVILTVLYSALSILRHNHFQSGGFDLGIFDQQTWQYSRFLYPYNTIKDRFILGDHLELTMPLMAPLYWLWDDVRMLLIFQAFWLSFSAIAIYALSRLRKFSETVSLVLAFVYSIFFGLQFAVFSDFHSVIIGVGLLPWVAYFLESGRKKLLIASIALLLLTQENMGISLAGLGLIYFFRKDFRKTSFIFIILGIFASLISAKIISFMSPAGFQYWPQISLNPFTNLKELFDSPEKRDVWLYSLAGFGFLPLLSPGAILAVVLDLSQYFVTGPEFARMWSPFMHHRAILAPLLALGTLEAFELFRKKKLNLNVVAIVLLIFVLGQQYFFHLPLNKLTKADYWKEEPWMKDDEKLISLVPAGASVATQQNFVPHLSHRKEIYLVYPRPHDFDFSEKLVALGGTPCGRRSCWWLDFPDKPQYLVVDTRPNQWLTQTLESNEHWLAAIGNMERAGKIKLVNQMNAAKMYKIEY